MKKILTIGCIIAATALACEAQIAKGKSKLGGFLSYYSSADEDHYPSSSGVTQRNNYRFEIAPMYGYFLSDKIELGLSVGFISDIRRIEYYSYNGPAAKIYEIDFTVGPYATIYHPIAERFYFNIAAAVNYVSGSVKSPAVDLNKLTGFNASLNPGLIYFFNHHWAVGIGAGIVKFQNTVWENDDTNAKYKSNKFDFKLSLASLSYGAGYYF